MFETNGYLGFTFAGRHSSEFGLLVVSDGSRYHQNLSSQFSDTSISVPGKNGSYYFGTQLGNREFEINCVFDDITSHTMHKIQHWLYPNVIGWLIFDEQPYKRYLVKLSNVPIFNFLPFDEFKSASDYTFQKEILKGEINLSFYSMQEYGVYNPAYELPIISKNELVTQQILDSGLLPKDYMRNGIYLPHENIKFAETANQIFGLYNAGNGTALADFYITIEKDRFTGPLEIKNYNDGVTYILTNPLGTMQKKCSNIDSVISYRIEILGNKQEVYCIGLNDRGIDITEKINIGAHYNHYFPKVYHTKPTESCIFTQVVNDNTSPEPIFYTFTYNDDDSMISSDEKDPVHTFEEFKEYWNDYSIISRYGSYEINNIISPSTIFINYPADYNYTQTYVPSLYKELCFLIYPNKYSCNYSLTKFIAEYDHTYI